MNSSRPYLIRAIYEWIVDNGLTPHMLVNAGLPLTRVPEEFVEDGRIVLNLSVSAVQGLLLGNEQISFSARFSGKSSQIVVPVNAVIALYARENGKGMVFPEEPAISEATAPESADTPKKPVFTVVK
jgi:stringent starvation protein B